MVVILAYRVLGGPGEGGCMADEATWDAVILAGGRARRLGGVDKPALVIGDRSLLDVALAACVGARHRVVVGPERVISEPVRWARESPAGSGPLAALAAGLVELPTGSDVVVVLASDLPLIDPAVVSRLRAAVTRSREIDGAVIVDAEGKLQPLVAAYRRRALDEALGALGVLRDRPVREMLGQLTVATILDAAAAGDIDTPADLARLRRP
jgi:molybdopterin-guanine dinucleotide biosynthesis protein A